MPWPTGSFAVGVDHQRDGEMAHHELSSFRA
jgi:hypothetical protein